MTTAGEHLFYEGPQDALQKSIASSGKPQKQIACAVYPGRQPETAKSLLSRGLSPENTDVRINIENLLTIMRETRPEDFIYYLCDEFGFERPLRKQKADIKKQLASEIQGLNKRLAVLMKCLPAITDEE
jgi:hypothetical protein